jgi:hypothetical protein
MFNSSPAFFSILFLLSIFLASSTHKSPQIMSDLYGQVFESVGRGPTLTTVQHQAAMRLQLSR